MRVHRRGEDARFDKMLDKREGLPGLCSADHESYAESAELYCLAFLRR